MIIAWQNYIKSLAAANKLVAHGQPDALTGVTRNTFSRNNDFLEAEAASITDLHTPYVVCGPVDGIPLGQLPSMRKKIRTTLFFLGHVGVNGNGITDTLENVQQQTFEVMCAFISHFIKDYEATGTCGPFSKLDPTRMPFQQVGPYLQADYGWRLQVEFVEAAPEFSFDASKWNS